MNKSEVEIRLERIVNIYDKLKEFLDSLPAEIPSEIKKELIKIILGDENLKKLIEGIKHRRPPKFLLIGRTGAGKSSLINAMHGKYLAKTSDVRVGTTNACRYDIKFMGKTIFEIIDSCGFGESLKTDVADKSLQEVVRKFSPDAILFLLKAKDRAFINQDAANIKNLSELSGTKIPVIVVLTQVDELEPALEKTPKNYSEWKMGNINDAVCQVKNILKENKVEYLEILPTSSLVQWDKNPMSLPEHEWYNLQMNFDGRYGIDYLLDLLENNIDIKAGIFLMLAARADAVARKIANRLTNTFATIAAGIGATPIPVSDIWILTALQIVLIMVIAFLGGREISYNTAKELLVSMAGVGAVGFTLRSAFQQGSKLVNLIYPGAGSFISGSLAALGTREIGKYAVAYYIGASIESENEAAATKNEAK